MKTKGLSIVRAFAVFVVMSMAAQTAYAQRSLRIDEPVRQILDAATLAREAGDSEKERTLLEQGIEATGTTNPSAFPLYQMLGQNYADYGNLAKAVALIERQLATARMPSQAHSTLIKAISLYANLHLMGKTREFLDRLEKLQPRLRAAPGWEKLGDFWQAGTAWAKANVYTAQGNLADAEPAWEACLSSSEKHLRGNPDDPGALFYLVDCTTGLMKIQIATGQLAAAGALADQQRAAVERVTEVAKRPIIATRVAHVYGRLAVEQGRPDEARRIYLSALQVIEAANASDASLRAANLRAQLAMVEMLQSRWGKALELYRQREDALNRAKGERGNMGPGTVEYAYTLQRLGKTAEAIQMLRRIVASSQKKFNEDSIFLWEGHAFLGVALAAAGQREEAMRELRVAMPRIFDIAKGERTSSEAGVLRTARLNWLFEGYIGLLADAADAGDAASMDEAFRLADLARGSTVQRALATSAFRANVSDEALAGLARREQDLQREISSLSESIGNLQSRGRVAEQDKILVDMRATLSQLRDQHDKTQAEIEQRFPDYSALLNPRPIGIAATQKLLKPSEAVISVYVSNDRTLVWAIPARGSASFAIVPLTREQLDIKVKTLREDLDPNAEASGKLPRFRFDIAHELYTQLLKPVEAGWKGAQELIVIPHGRLGQLPFSVLITQPFQGTGAKLPYAEMANVSWLVKQVAISQLPAAVALPALRAQGKGHKAEFAFIGFGDPVFAAEAAQTASVSGRTSRSPQWRNLGVTMVAPTPGAEPELAPAINFRLLPALPDTALEIQEVADTLSADKARDVFLQKRASEGEVKKMDLSPYRVVMFATHGLMNGEMPGLFQPALALSNPEIARDGEDGMLTMEEILGLKLNADWVVLSACNSAAAGGTSGESVSGLGRAFFYAGAKSLLVTNWAVETESARMLTTNAFRYLIKDPTLSRAKALQQSSLSLMNQTAGKDFSYAHPMFWAPYSLVGDGGL
jgi:CHAT domain-containing protein